MFKRKAMFINAVPSGGEVYIEYLKQFYLSLPSSYFVDAYNVFERTLIKSDKVSEMLGIPVKDVNLGDLPFFCHNDFNVAISNDAFIGQYLDSSIKSIFISHGSAVMPAVGQFMYGDVLSFFDVVTASSRPSMRMLANGVSSYRAFRRRDEVRIVGPAIRSDLRVTSFMPIRPIKQERRHAVPQSEVPDNGFTIGLLPTQVGAVQEGVSLYNNLTDIILMLVQKFPNSPIVFRPYPLDFLNQSIRDYCNALKNTGRIQVDETGSSSAEFYRRCDIVITDGSTGGISFMLRKTVPPVYFIPTTALENKITQWFVDSMKTRVPVVHNLHDLEDAILVIATSSKEKTFDYYLKYCDNDLFLLENQDEYVSRMVQEGTELANTITVDAFGTMRSTLEKDPT